MLAQLPVAALCILGVALQNVPHSTEDPVRDRRKRSLDFSGLVSFTLAMVAFLVVLDLAARPDGLGNPLVIVFTILFLVFGVTFLLVEAYWANRPIIPLALLKRPSVGLHYLVQTLCMCAQFTVSVSATTDNLMRDLHIAKMVSNIATFFARTQNASNTSAALHIVPAPLGNAIGALVGGRIMSK